MEAQTAGETTTDRKKVRRNAFVLDGEEEYQQDQQVQQDHSGTEDIDDMSLYDEQEDKISSQSISKLENSLQPMGLSTVQTSEVKNTGLHLTNQQVMAFKEVFDLFDSNGGGTIDAEELELALKSVDIHLTQDEVIDVLMEMDKDGNGEIDFGEFLHLMTNTERFVEGFDSTQSSNNRRRRETMLFEALTQFMKRSALHSINEIVGFYHTKYKRAPHVVGHYAAGARLIGLTEQQLRKLMETLKAKHAAGDEKSPYAEPLHIVFGTIVKKKRKNKKPAQEKEDFPMIRGKIKLKFTSTGLLSRSAPPIPEAHKEPSPRKQSKNTLDAVLPRRRMETQAKKYKRNGWLAQRIKPFAVELPMPAKSRGTGKLSPHLLTFDDLPTIREKVAQAKQLYFEHVHDRKRKECEEHWNALGPSYIHSDVLRNYFRLAFNAYTPFAHIDKSRVWPKANKSRGRSKSVMNRKVPPQTPVIPSRSTRAKSTCE